MKRANWFLPRRVPQPLNHFTQLVVVRLALFALFWVSRVFVLWLTSCRGKLSLSGLQALGIQMDLIRGGHYGQ